MADTEHNVTDPIALAQPTRKRPARKRPTNAEAEVLRGERDGWREKARVWRLWALVMAFPTGFLVGAVVDAALRSWA